MDEEKKKKKQEKKKKEEEPPNAATCPTINELPDRKNRGVAGMLTHFQNLVMIATEPVPDEGALEAAAAQGLRLQVEMAALVRAVPRYSSLPRALLWTDIRAHNDDDHRLALPKISSDCLVT